jgi:hypothetical protein
LSLRFREGRAFGIRQHRHVVIAFSRWHIQETPNEPDDLLDLQASHSTAVSNNVYAIDIRSHAHIPPNILRQYQRLNNKFADLIRLDDFGVLRVCSDDLSARLQDKLLWELSVSKTTVGGTLVVYYCTSGNCHNVPLHRLHVETKHKTTYRLDPRVEFDIPLRTSRKSTLLYRSNRGNIEQYRNVYNSSVYE